TIYLPRAAEGSAPAQQPTVAAATVAGGQTVLVIDDEEIVTAVLRTALEHSGYYPLIARSGPEGLELLRGNADRIAMVILDLKMPGMDGGDVLRRLREITADVPVIITSGFSEEEAARSFARHEVTAFLPKPFSVEALRAMLRRVRGE